MARMYPTPMDSRTESQAEKQLYAAFRDELAQEYLVFHSVAWQSLDGNGRRRDGEADYVIAHPEASILILEVKGGRIQYDPRSRKWVTINRAGRSNTLKVSPFTQAKESKYVLRTLLATMLSVPPTSFNLSHAVAFPDTVVGSDALGPDMPRDIILDKINLANLPGWVGRVLTYWRGTQPKAQTAPGKRAIEALLELLGKQRELRPALWGDLVLEQKALIQLTEQQYLILDMLNSRRRAAIQGCAGSGKTLIALEKASRLAHQGFRVLLTCYNKHLANDLRGRLTLPRNLDIIHFHELCFQMAEEAGVLPPKEANFYGQQLPQALLAAVEKLGPRYDAIVVDEGQDFRDEWWFPLQTLLRQPDDGILYIFWLFWNLGG